MREHYLNASQVLAEAWSVEDGALKFIPSANTQFAVALDAADGDNVRTIPNNATVSEADGAVSCAGMKTVCLFGSGTVSVSPDGVAFYALSLSPLIPASICAMQIKIVGAGKIVVQAV